MIIFENTSVAHSKHFNTIDDISLEIKQGERVAFVGDEYSGNVALLRTIAGLEKIKTGTLTIDGKSIEKIDFVKDVSLGYLTKRAVFFEHKSVYQNLIWALRVHKVGSKARKERIIKVLGEFDFGSVASKRVRKLSEVEHRILQIIRLALRPLDIILIDDVLNNFEGEDLERVKNALNILLKHCNSDSVILLATPDMSAYDNIVQNTYHMQDGAIVATEQPKVAKLTEVEPIEVVIEQTKEAETKDAIKKVRPMPKYDPNKKVGRKKKKELKKLQKLLFIAPEDLEDIEEAETEQTLDDTVQKIKNKLDSTQKLGRKKKKELKKKLDKLSQ